MSGRGRENEVGGGRGREGGREGGREREREIERDSFFTKRIVRGFVVRGTHARVHACVQEE